MLLGTTIDITEVADALQQGLYVTDLQRRIVYWNQAAERITGFAAEEVVGHRCADNILTHVDEQGNALCLHGCPLTQTIDDRTPRECEVYLHHKAGHRVPVKVRAQPVVDATGAVVGALEVFSDARPADVLRAQIVQLEALALLDPLTQLPNRRYLASEVASQLGMQRRSGLSFGLVFLDIDTFKLFNDDYGHEAGDLALQTVARTLAGTVRPQDTVGRWGGDEFVAILPQAEDATLRAVAQRLPGMVRHSRVLTGSTRLSVTVSAGATLAVPGDTLETLVERADALMYRSKHAGRDTVTFETP